MTDRPTPPPDALARLRAWLETEQAHWRKQVVATSEDRAMWLQWARARLASIDDVIEQIDALSPPQPPADAPPAWKARFERSQRRWGHLKARVKQEIEAFSNPNLSPQQRSQYANGVARLQWVLREMQKSPDVLAEAVTPADAPPAPEPGETLIESPVDIARRWMVRQRATNVDDGLDEGDCRICGAPKGECHEPTDPCGIIAGLLTAALRPAPPEDAEREALRELIIDANRLCDRNQGGTYEADCRASIAKARKALVNSVGRAS